MLTKRQKQILDFVVLSSNKKGVSPTIDEIRKHFRLNSVATIHQHLEALRSKGYLDRKKNKPRSSVISKNRDIEKIINKARYSGFSFIPILGSANAGPASIFAQENIEGFLKVPQAMIKNKKKVFLIQIEGNSMNKASIEGENLEDGDFALIDPNYKNPENGEYILSVIDGMANLKKFEIDKKQGYIKLISESTESGHLPIYISNEDNFMVNGKIIGVLKK